MGFHRSALCSGQVLPEVNRADVQPLDGEWRFLHSDIMAYLESSSNERLLAMAAKGGAIDSHDLEIIKKKYGEEMSHLCRTLFPTILEQEGELSNILFNISKDSYL